jgi:AraC-like DNA-binding protein
MSPLSTDQLQVLNVRPAYAASRARGVSSAALEAVGLPEAVLQQQDGVVTGQATYQHMELMAERADFPEFLLDAVQRHTVSSLGVVGLACKTLRTLGEAMACHQRFQHLTNQTARYTSVVEGDTVVLREERWGPPRLGLLLVSDYTMLVAVRLMTLAAGQAPPVRAVTSRRPDMPAALRAAMASSLQAPIQTGAPHASLTLPAAWLQQPVHTADEELADYFRQCLARAAATAPDESLLLGQVRSAIQAALATGTPRGAEVSRRLAMSQRTLQRRLCEAGVTFEQLVSDTRRRLAEGYLADATLSLAEVAYLLGYREESAFFRACQRWVGQTPTAWRAQLSA